MRTTEQMRKWRRTWINKCMKSCKCIVCGGDKEIERIKFNKCKKCQKRSDINKLKNPQIRPNGRKLIKSIHEVLCSDCKPKIKDIVDFWYNGRL